ncbi:MAG: hypothetical protein R3F53_24550 [Gammaproteobacteria bacterium]
MSSRRLALARAWALRPQRLLDEPTASLDPAAVRIIERGWALSGQPARKSS